MHPVDVLILLAFLAYAVWAGFRSREAASRDLESYFLAGRSLSGWKAGVSMAATQFAADTPLLVTGIIATAGIFGLWRLWIYGISFLLVGFILAPSWRRAGVLTDAELAEARYGAGVPSRALRVFKAVYFGTVFNCTVLAMVLLAATRIAEPFFPWNEWLPAAVFGPIESVVRAVGTPVTGQTGAAVWTLSANNVLSLGIILLTVTFYSTTGGLRSVVQTDILQFALAIGGTLIYAVYVVSACGGFSGLAARLAETVRAAPELDLTTAQILAFTPSGARDAGAAILALFALQWLVQINSDGTGYIAQRTMACRTDRDAVQASVVFTVAQILVRSLIWLPIGIGLLVLFPPVGAGTASFTAAREATFVQGIADLLPVGARGLLLASLLAALASTIDTHLNWGASYWTNDIVKPFAPAVLKRDMTGRELVWVARGSNLVIVILSIVVMTRLSSIQTAWHASLLLGAGMGVLLVLRWLWWRMNVWGEIGAIAASLLLAPVLLGWLPAEREALRLLLMAGGATAAGILASLATPPPERRGLEEFYRRARPPGFWAPIARTAGDVSGDSRRRLARGAAATAISSLALFSLLTGIGSWMMGSPPPAWFPWRAVWIALLLVSGSALFPIGIRLGFRSDADAGGAPANASGLPPVL